MKYKTLSAITLVLATLALAGSNAIAQQHGQSGTQMPGMGQGPGMMGSMMQGRMMGRDCPMMGMMMGATENSFAKGRVAFLKAELEVTAAQSAAFDAYSEALKDNLQSMHAMRQSMMDAMSAKSPVERLDTHLTMMETRIDSLKAIKPKLEAFYATLSDEQKKKANQLLTGMGCMM